MRDTTQVSQLLLPGSRVSFEMGTHELTQGVGSIVNPGGSRNTSNDTMLQKWEINSGLL